MTKRAAASPVGFPTGLKGVIFDCDGVIFDSRAAHIAYYNRIRSSIGLPNLSREEENYVHMSTVRQALIHIIPEHMRASAEAAVALIRYNLEVLPSLAVEPDLPELLQECRRRALRLGICTNRISAMDELLHAFELEDYFDPVQTAADCAPKPSPDGLLAVANAWGILPEQAVYIGDSKVDEMAAQAARMPFWAFRNRELTAVRHFENFSEIRSWFDVFLKKL